MLFFFDHNVSSQLAQQEQFNLKKPPAYHYDFMLLSLMVSQWTGPLFLGPTLLSLRVGGWGCCCCYRNQ